MSYMEFATKPIMWLACGLGILTVLVQSILFVKKAMHVGTEMGITKEQFKIAIRSGIFSSVGPCMAIIAGMAPILVSLGGAISWMRIGLIGSIAYELMAADFGATAAGSTLGGEMSAIGYSNAVFTMAVGTTGYLLVSVFLITKLDKFRLKIAGGNPAMLPVLSTAAMAGAFAYLSVSHVVTFQPQKIAAVLAGFAITAILLYLEKKKGMKWLREWNLTIAMFGGMFASLLAS